MKRLFALLALVALTSGLWAQGSLEQTKVRTVALSDSEDSDDLSLNLSTASAPIDTLVAFRPAKWTSLMFAVNGTMGTGSIEAHAWCGARLGGGASLLAICDSLTISDTGHYIWQLNIPTSDIVSVVWSTAPTVTSVTIDTIRAALNW